MPGPLRQAHQGTRMRLKGRGPFKKQMIQATAERKLEMNGGKPVLRDEQRGEFVNRW